MLKDLSKFSALEELELHGNNRSNNGLEELTKIPTLTRVSLWGNPKITDAAVKELRKHKPNLDIEY